MPELQIYDQCFNKIYEYIYIYLTYKYIINIYGTTFTPFRNQKETMEQRLKERAEQEQAQQTAPAAQNDSPDEVQVGRGSRRSVGCGRATRVGPIRGESDMAPTVAMKGERVDSTTADAINGEAVVKAAVGVESSAETGTKRSKKARARWNF